MHFHIPSYPYNQKFCILLKSGNSASMDNNIYSYYTKQQKKTPMPQHLCTLTPQKDIEGVGSENVIQNSVSCKLQTMALDALIVQQFKLRLTLVEFFMVTLSKTQEVFLKWQNVFV